MTSKRKFHRTTFKVVVMSEEKLRKEEVNLGQLAYECIDGEWVGELTCEKQEVLGGKQAAQAMLALNGDPDFFNLTEDGEDTEEE